MIPLFKVSMSRKAGVAVQKVLDSGWITESRVNREFEERLQEVFGRPTLTTNSGTSALLVALRDLNPGDEVLASPVTCTATTCAIVLQKGTPVWVDVDPKTGILSWEDACRKRTPRTKAIVVVGYGGRPVPSPPEDLLDLHIVLDNAHALSKAPGWADTCYSFQAIKFLTCGDGGALVVANREDLSSARRYKWFGLDRRIPEPFLNDNTEKAGGKFHMNDIAAAIGLSNLSLALYRKIEHQELARWFHTELQGLPGDEILLPPHDPQCDYWIFPLLVKHRDDFIKEARKEGIQAGRAHGRNDLHTAFPPSSGPLPGVDSFDDHQACIPCGWWVTVGEATKIVEFTRKWARSHT